MMLNDIVLILTINTQSPYSTVLNIIEVYSDSELDLPLRESQFMKYRKAYLNRTLFIID